MTNKQVIHRCIYVVFALLILVIALVGGRIISPAFADTTQYTSVLDDLKVDSSFDASIYPVKSNDISIQIIQIAESVDKELFVYTYQPSGDMRKLTASKISISLNGNETNSEWRLYDLQLLNRKGVFCKYSVAGFKVSSEVVRYYNISEILRPWNSSIDNSSGNDNTIDSVPYSVGQLWTVKTVGENISYLMERTDVVEITNLYANSIRYMTGHVLFYHEACDVFFLAFSTDHKIDTLSEADVDFTYYPYQLMLDRDYKPYMDMPTHVDTRSPTHAVAKLKADGKTERDGYTWKWIQSSKEFLAEESSNISSEVKSIVEKQQWVLRFFGCEISLIPVGPILSPTYYECKGYTAEEVSILRLKFVTDGITYNLGTVSKQVTPSITPTQPDSPKSWWERFLEWLKRNWYWIPLIVVGVVLIILFFPIIFPALFSVFPYIGKGLLWLGLMLGKALLWLLCLPFKGIAALVRKIKERRGTA